MGVVPAKNETGVPLSVRMAKVLDEPLRIKIVLELTMREMSATQFYKRFGGGSPSRVWRHFKVCEKYGWIELKRSVTGGGRRSATEHLYRAVRPVLFDNAIWASLPQPLQNSVTFQAFSTFLERAVEAMAAGTVDAREDRHTSWTPLSVDQEGWDNVLPRVDKLFEYIFEEQERARERMAKSGEEPIPMTVALYAFESPKDDGPKAP